MENYIVRIYRSEKNDPFSLVGVVEKVGVEGKKAFTNIDELWEILNFQKSREGGDERDNFGFGDLGGNNKGLS